jgi:hypothetical protein
VRDRVEGSVGGPQVQVDAQIEAEGKDDPAYRSTAMTCQGSGRRFQMPRCVAKICRQDVLPRCVAKNELYQILKVDFLLLNSSHSFSLFPLLSFIKQLFRIRRKELSKMFVVHS